MAPRIYQARIVDGFLAFYGIKVADIAFFKGFPRQLARFEEILHRIPAPAFPEHVMRALICDMGESLVKIYVEEVTGRSFSEDIAVLLSAAAEAYGIEHCPSYSAAAVDKRIGRFKKQHSKTYWRIQLLVRKFRSAKPDMPLNRFIDQMTLALLQLELTQNPLSDGISFAGFEKCIQNR